MNVKGVLDRIVDGKQAVIIVESEKKEFIISCQQLPASSKEGDWFDLKIVDGKVKSLSYNKALTNERKNLVEDKMARLKKLKGSKFKR